MFMGIYRGAIIIGQKSTEPAQVMPKVLSEVYCLGVIIMMQQVQHSNEKDPDWTYTFVHI